jgi:hypothetical protein
MQFFFTELITESTLFHNYFFLSPLYIFMYVKKLIFGNQQLFIHALFYFIFVGFKMMLLTFHKTMLSPFYVCTCV